MVERKMYKTKLCMLYQRGSCSRQHCNFAHGDADLRRSSFNERDDYRGRDLRERLDRKHSPPHKILRRENIGERHPSHGDDRHSLGKRINRNHREREELDGNSDYSGSLRMSDGNDKQSKDRRQTSSGSRYAIDEQLRQMQSEIQTLDAQKQKLESYLEDKAQEADSLTLKIQELEMKLQEEKENCKRITTKIKKFIKAHNHQRWLKEELERSQAQLQKLGEQLASDAVGTGDDYDMATNILNDDETAGNREISRSHEPQRILSSSKKRSRFDLEAHHASTQANPSKEERNVSGKVRKEKLSRWNEHLSSGKKSERDGDASNGYRSMTEDEDLGRGKNVSSENDLLDKVCESGAALPATGIAANAMYEDVEAADVVEPVSTRIKAQGVSKMTRFSFLPPPPPPIPENVYLQYKGDDETVDIGGGDEEITEVDII